jgi:hypothetical protein
MPYKAALAQIAQDHRAELEGDLFTARAEYATALELLESAKRRMHMLEGLLNGVSTPEALEPREAMQEMTLHAAMHKVLSDSPTGKLRAGEIISEIARLNLYRMRDGRVPESQQIHARANHYPELFGKDGPFFFAK